MTLGTMDDKTTSPVQQPSITIVQQSEESGENAGGKKSRVTRKHVIVGVTCALVVAMVITGVIVGVKFHLDSTNEVVTRTFEFMEKNNKKVKEDVSVDVKDNYVQYHMKDDDTEIWVIEDFNRGLQMMKVTQPAGTKCFIATLNTSESALPEAVLNATATDETLEEDDKYYEVSQMPLKEKSMLGRHGQELYDNLEVYWLIQTCRTDGISTSPKTGSGREKRQALCPLRRRRSGREKRQVLCPPLRPPVPPDPEPPNIPEPWLPVPPIPCYRCPPRGCRWGLCPIPFV